ncbi:MAG: cysteine desulfurase [Cyclobacteriaceae bacterium]|nr:cysteine desulfurase [Cyclobacteriaceae bacterium]
MKVYFDNAATTPIDPLVFEAMTPWLTSHWGNASSTHSFGREAKAAIEMSRKTIAELLNAAPGEIYFTSGGTEGDNTVLKGICGDAGFSQAISSPLEHHAVLHTLEAITSKNKANLTLLDVNEKGELDYEQLEELLKENPPTLVSLMYANNEIGNINNIELIGSIVKEYNGYFHSDTVQAMGHYKIDSKKIQIDAMVCSAHKIHGPKGSGFMYLKKDKRIPPFMVGGGQERNMRGGTENVAGIVGLTKAFTLAHERMEDDHKHIQVLKDRMISGLTTLIPGISFNGNSENPDSLYTVLNARLPASEENEFLLFNLDMKGIAASGGSACNSGSDKGSHVLEALGMPSDSTGVRFSFSKYNTPEEVDYVLEAVKECLGLS